MSIDGGNLFNSVSTIDEDRIKSIDNSLLYMNTSTLVLKWVNNSDKRSSWLCECRCNKMRSTITFFTGHRHHVNKMANSLSVMMGLLYRRFDRLH